MMIEIKLEIRDRDNESRSEREKKNFAIFSYLPLLLDGFGILITRRTCTVCTHERAYSFHDMMAQHYIKNWLFSLA